jgi:hypothetical protein
MCSAEDEGGRHGPDFFMVRHWFATHTDRQIY